MASNNSGCAVVLPMCDQGLREARTNSVVVIRWLIFVFVLDPLLKFSLPCSRALFLSTR